MWKKLLSFFKRPVLCPDCEGYGTFKTLGQELSDIAKAVTVCSTCKGTGQLPRA